MTALAARILAVLPQTQCTRCGYLDCAAYAQAVSGGTAGINQCPPGGAQGIAWLAAITGQPLLALNPVHGAEAARNVAFVDEDWCIGCTLCLQACPTDAILGSNKLMHTVIEAYCTGCELCLPVCPVDCIELENVTQQATGWAAWSRGQADLARSRYELNRYRRNGDQGAAGQPIDDTELLAATDLAETAQHTDPSLVEQKRSAIEAAMAGARAKRDASHGAKPT